MKKSCFKAKNWRDFIPKPIYGEHPEYNELYMKAWELAYDHIMELPGMPQNPYMDEAFCRTQFWIWDTCFMSLFCKYAREVFPGIETFNNFFEVLHNGGHLPKVIPPENEPEWTNAKPGVPFEAEIHIADNPPLFAWAEYENALFDGDVDYIKELLYERKFLQKHYEWFENQREPGTLRGVHIPTCLIAEKYGYKWEGARSGMDNTPRGRIGEHVIGQRPNNPDMLWLDAICEQALSALAISRLFTIVGDTDGADEWNKKYLEKKDIVNRLYYDEEDGFYYDIDCNTHDFYKIMTIASYWTMTAEIATKERAQSLLTELLNPDTLGGNTPFLSLSKKDADYAPDGEYWRGAIWLPTAYAALKGLTNYGMHKEAHGESVKLLDHMYKTYTEFSPHTIWECYAPESYSPGTTEHQTGRLSRPDFCGWSALGPISVYIEFVLGFHTVNAFNKTVEWEKPSGVSGNIGIKNLRFGNIITDIEADGNKCTVTSNGAYTLKICDKAYGIHEGVNEIVLD